MAADIARPNDGRVIAVRFEEIVSHDTKHAIVNVAEEHDVETIVHQLPPRVRRPSPSTARQYRAGENTFR